MLSSSAMVMQASAQTSSQPDLLEGAKNLFNEMIAPVPAERYWYVQGSVWTRHFSPQSDHNNNQDLVGLEYHRDDSYLWGAATFRHSFGVRSYYAYGGKRFDFAGTPFNAKLTAGFLHGYRGKYRDKIPLNRFGIAPAAIPSIGVSYGPVGVDLVLLGAAAAMINVGIKL